MKMAEDGKRWQKETPTQFDVAIFDAAIVYEKVRNSVKNCKLQMLLMTKLLLLLPLAVVVVVVSTSNMINIEHG